MFLSRFYTTISMSKIRKIFFGVVGSNLPPTFGLQNFGGDLKFTRKQSSSLSSSTKFEVISLNVRMGEKNQRLVGEVHSKATMADRHRWLDPIIFFSMELRYFSLSARQHKVRYHRRLDQPGRNFYSTTTMRTRSSSSPSERSDRRTRQLCTVGLWPTFELTADRRH